MRTVAAVAVHVLMACSCSQSGSPAAPSDAAPIRVLMLTATAGFRHDSITAARQTMTTLAAAGGFAVTPTEDLGSLSAATLASYDVLFFALTSGELALTDAQKAAVLSFVSGGKGFMGAHSATDTLYEWPEYGAMLGAYFREHPWTGPATVIVENSAHPATAGLSDRFTVTEEFYTFRDNPRPRVQVLLRLDAASVGASGDFPLAWAHTVGSGRVYYNALGHFSETWRDERFHRQLTGAIRWAAGR